MIAAMRSQIKNQIIICAEYLFIYSVFWKGVKYIIMLPSNNTVLNSPATLIAIIGALLLSGCGSVSHDVVLASGYSPSSEVSVVLGDVVDAAPEFERGEELKDYDIAKAMRSVLETKLRESGLQKASGSTERPLVLSVTIVDYEPGSAFKRWLMPGYGSTVLSVEGALFDGDKKLATISARRTVDAGGGYTVGAWKTIFEDVADDIVSDLSKELRGQS